MCGFCVLFACFVLCMVGTWERVASHSQLSIPGMPRATLFGVNQFSQRGWETLRRQSLLGQGQNSKLQSAIQHRRQWQPQKQGLQSDGGSCGMSFYYNAQCTSYFEQCPDIIGRFRCGSDGRANFLLLPKTFSDSMCRCKKLRAAIFIRKLEY